MTHMRANTNLDKYGQRWKKAHGLVKNDEEENSDTI